VGLNTCIVNKFDYVWYQNVKQFVIYKFWRTWSNNVQLERNIEWRWSLLLFFSHFLPLPCRPKCPWASLPSKSFMSGHWCILNRNQPKDNKVCSATSCPTNRAALSGNHCIFFSFLITVKLGYNNHGYNELTVLTNNVNLLVWFSIFYQWNFMLITNNNFHICGYNEQNNWDFD